MSIANDRFQEELLKRFQYQRFRVARLYNALVAIEVPWCFSGQF